MTKHDEDSSQPNLRETLLDLTVDSWRFARLFTRVIAKLDAGEGGRYAAQLRYFVKRLEDGLASANLRLVNLEGQPYDPGVAAAALNLSDFGPDDRLIIEQMVEPIVMGPEGLVRAGTVMLSKVQ